MPFQPRLSLSLRFLLTAAGLSLLVACGPSATQPDNATPALSPDEFVPVVPVPGPAIPQDPVPRVALIGDSALYVPKEEFKFRVKVQTASGSMKGIKVYFRTSNGTRWAGSPTETDGIFEFRPTLYGFGFGLTIWAEDAEGNSGKERGAPYEASITVGVDRSAPLMGTYNQLTYDDERYLHLLRDEFGNLILPAVYDSIHPRNPLTDRAVYKTPARASWGPTPPTAVELESTNKWNTPFFRFYVGYNPATEAPLTNVEYCVGSTCNPALPSPNSENDSGLKFDAPIAVESVPEIANLKAESITLPVKIVATDAAGNRAELSLGDITYNVVPPPVSVKEDPYYETDSATDPRSASFYRYNPERVLALFKAPSIQTLRLKRFEIRNPGTVPVTVVLPKNGVSTIDHSWLDANLTPPQSAPGTFLSPDGRPWASNPQYQASPSPGCNVPTNPCANGTAPIYRGGAFQCGSLLPTSGTSVSRRALPLQYEAVTGPFRVYPQETIPLPAQEDATTYRFKVPAARDGVPGLVVLYVSRAVPADFAPEFALQDLGIGRVTIQGWKQDGWKQVSLSPCCGGLSICGNYVAQRWATLLESSTEELTGTLKIETHNAQDDLNISPTVGPSPSPAPSFAKTFRYY